ncbi:MAG: hypothetical protein ABJA02_16035 [Acidobacteriota bacterium]
MTNIEYQRGAISAGDCISNAWSLVTNKFWLYVGLGLLALILISCIPIANLFIMGPIMGGFYYVALRDMRGDPVEFGMLFKGFDRFVPLMVVGLIQAIPGIIFQVLRFTVNISNAVGNGTGGHSGGSDPFKGALPDFSALIAGLSAMVILSLIGFSVFAAIWNVALTFAVPIALENEIGPIEAIKLSIRAAFSNVGGLVLLIIFDILVGFLGFLAFCLGYFVAIPVIFAANAFAYRQVFPIANSPFNYAPPPPSEYGSSFGSGM